MNLEQIIRTAREQGASDIHLEGGLPLALRIRGNLRMTGEPLTPSRLTAFAREVIGEDGWNEFLERRSWDLSRTVNGVRCRIHVLRSARGVGFAIRLLSSFQATLKKLNLHPDLKRLVQVPHGLVLICGATGSGKTTTLAALLQELNLSEARHIVTVESPIEYALTPRQSFIRQREVGRDTPSFAQALIDAMREDPDVLMVGEMREPEVMQLTLHAAETGHLVLATVHSSSASEALQRIVSSFPSEIQNSVSAHLADVLVGVVSQRLIFREDLGVRVPECEILVANHAVKSLVRAGQFFKLMSVIETGAADGMWTFTRYREWLAKKTDWSLPGAEEELPAEPSVEVPDLEPLAGKPKTPSRPASRPPRTARRPEPSQQGSDQPAPDGILEISEQDDPEAILRELEGKA